MTIVYGLFFVLTLIAALGVVLFRNAVHAAISLIAAMLTLSVLYLLIYSGVSVSLGGLAWALQAIVYAGAIIVLFLFVIMMLNLRHPERPAPRLRWLRTAGLLFALILALQTIGFVYNVFSFSAPGEPGSPGAARLANEPSIQYVQNEGDTVFDNVAALMLTQYALPFELTSILLLVAILGAVIVTREETDDDVAEVTEGSGEPPSAEAAGEEKESSA